jgi:hypothetical protein
MDFIGVTRSIDQAIYTLLNSLAIILWRIDSAIIGMSLYSYATQDWLTGNGGGVWYIMDWLLNTSGLFGINTWTLFAGMALMLWGLSRIARPFIPSSPVHPGKLLVFFVLSYVVISQGSALMQDIESWRLDAGSAVYESVASGSSPSISVPSVPSTSDPLAPPADLDGQSPIRGWEAVASSYFLAANSDDLHQPYPPEAFRVAYCLYNPDQPIENQATENAQGCSPRNAWDEWDIGDLSILEDILGLDVGQAEDALEEFLEVLLGDIDLNLTSPVPMTVHHPENRELGIRQAQAGVARLALGIIVALFPMVEANISLMLALAASFIYLTLPIVLLFGFFLATEPMVNRLLMQFINVIIRTLIISGIVALFMLLLMNTALSGSLTAYLGLVGVGLIGGFFLARIAAATMKETLSQSMGALGAVWMGSSTGLLGNAAAQPARAAMGVAKMGATAALMGAGGAMSFMDLAETGYEGFRSGAKDLRQGAPGTMKYVDKQAGRMPTSLARLAQAGLGSEGTDERSATGDARQTGPLTTLATAMAAPLAVGALAASSRSGSANIDQTEPHNHQQHSSSGQPGANGHQSKRWAAAASLSSLAAARTMTARNGHQANQQRQTGVNRWLDQVYQAQQTQRGQKQASEKGRDLLGEDLAWKAERALGRHTKAETKTVLDTAQQVATENDRDELVQNGRLTGQAITSVRDKLDPDTARAFSGQKGAWDIAALTAVALQQQSAVEPEEFRQAMAKAEAGWGQDSPGHNVPRTLGLDPVAAGAHYTAMNRFVRLSQEAGLTETQRERLLEEAQAGQVSDETRAEIEASLQQQQKQGHGSGVTTADVIAGAMAMPVALSGPEQVWTTPDKSQAQPGQPAGQVTNTVKTQSAATPREKKRSSRQVAAGQVSGQPMQSGQTGNLGQALKTSLKGQPSNKIVTKPDQTAGQSGIGQPGQPQGKSPATSRKQVQSQAKGQLKPSTKPASQGEPKTQTPVGQGATADGTGISSHRAAQSATGSDATQPPAAGQTTLGKDLKASLQDQKPGQSVDTPKGQQPANRKNKAERQQTTRTSQTEKTSPTPTTPANTVSAGRSEISAGHTTSSPMTGAAIEPPATDQTNIGQTLKSSLGEPAPTQVEASTSQPGRISSSHQPTSTAPAHSSATPLPTSQPISTPVGRAEPSSNHSVSPPTGTAKGQGNIPGNLATPPVAPETAAGSQPFNQVNFGQELRSTLSEQPPVQAEASISQPVSIAPGDQSPSSGVDMGAAQPPANQAVNVATGRSEPLDSQAAATVPNVPPHQSVVAPTSNQPTSSIPSPSATVPQPASQSTPPTPSPATTPSVRSPINQPVDNIKPTGDQSISTDQTRSMVSSHTTSSSTTPSPGQPSEKQSTGKTRPPANRQMPAPVTRKDMPDPARQEASISSAKTKSDRPEAANTKPKRKAGDKK